MKALTRAHLGIQGTVKGLVVNGEGAGQVIDHFSPYFSSLLSRHINLQL
jgi:hypothetical protein